MTLTARSLADSCAGGASVGKPPRLPQPNLIHLTKLPNGPTQIPSRKHLLTTLTLIPVSTRLTLRNMTFHRSHHSGMPQPNHQNLPHRLPPVVRRPVPRMLQSSEGGSPTAALPSPQGGEGWVRWNLARLRLPLPIHRPLRL